ncbi:hypothetical protein QBC43DRAFT_332065 [Cladorrhinum sp. PSN259]|nr:hypothetical protein QBC43DRAFT_332065 [Cladorrhinum sp. PSN259]
MASPLEKLPQELLEELTLYLPCASTANLVACSKILCQRVQPVLYRPPPFGHRNFAIYWACTKGHGAAIRRAVAYGASPAYVDTPSEVMEAQRRRPVVVSRPRTLDDPQQLTLFLAAKHFRLDAFTTLLELGATTEHDAVENSAGQCKDMMGNLAAHPEIGFPFLQALFGAGLHKEIEARHSPIVALPLVVAVKAKASPAVLEFLLHHGAELEQTVATQERILSTPLSAAFAVGSEGNIELLLSRGADIHGGNHDPPFGSPSHLPVFTAASQIVFQGPRILELCLSKGADINHRSCVKERGRSTCYNSTPLLHYLNSLRSPAFEQSTQLSISLEDGVTCLVQHGAVIHPHLEAPTPRHHRLPRRWRLSSTPSPIEILLDNWGIDMLRNTKFLALVRRLVELGAAAGPATPRLLTNYDVNPQDYDDKHWPEVCWGWKTFTNILLTAQPSNPCISKTLTSFIVGRGTAEETNLDRPPTNTHEYPGVGSCGTAVFNLLLADGADINHQADGGAPALHQLCMAWNEIAVKAAEDLDQDYLINIVLQRRRILLTMLVENGANPWILHHGKNAVELVSKDLDLMLPRHNLHTLRYLAILKKEAREEAIILSPRRAHNCHLELLELARQMGLTLPSGGESSSASSHSHSHSDDAQGGLGGQQFGGPPVHAANTVEHTTEPRHI